MARRTTALVLFAFSAACLVVSLANRGRVPEAGWTSYVPVEELDADAFAGLSIWDSVLWLGGAVAFATAAFIVLLSSVRGVRAAPTRS